jgi:hypothetical protein
MFGLNITVTRGKEEDSLPGTSRVPRWLLRVKLLDILHPKAEEVRKLGNE